MDSYKDVNHCISQIMPHENTYDVSNKSNIEQVYPLTAKSKAEQIYPLTAKTKSNININDFGNSL